MRDRRDGNEAQILLVWPPRQRGSICKARVPTAMSDDVWAGCKFFFMAGLLLQARLSLSCHSGAWRGPDFAGYCLSLV